MFAAGASAAAAEGADRVLAESEARVRTVRCASGQSLADVVSRARAGDVVVVIGECSGPILIATDGITIEGNGAAVLSGPGGGPPAEFSALVTVTGAHNVVISGLTLQGSNGEGILVQRAGAAVVRDTLVQDNLGTGIAVAEGSTVQLIDTVSRRNAIGLDVFTGSSAVLKGAVGLSENRGPGAEVNGQSILEIRGADV
ncbi:MAG TPA: right-handed parallel beta-helix repeat-containing protein, partial [Candidatus Limnocylindrales bacterium]|nr:right-handed parallel beta-helix repeat-containing protein [Candidatus Limnocylindrales bacterium]